MRISPSAAVRLCAVAAVFSISAFSFGKSATAMGRDDDIKLTGCLVRAENGAGYLLTNAPQDPAMVRSDDRKVAPSAVGTSGGFASVFYWLSGNNDLNEHVGQRVEVEGELKGDIRDGEIKTHRKDRWTEVEVKSSGQILKARVPNATFADDHDKAKGGTLVRRVSVDKVKMIGAGCE